MASASSRPRTSFVYAAIEQPGETSVDPEQCALVVLEVGHNDLVAEAARLHHEVELIVDEPGRTRLDLVQAQLQQRIESPVHARLQYAEEFALAEQQPALVGIDLHTTEHETPPMGRKYRPHRARGTSCIRSGAFRRYAAGGVTMAL
jgi:hypothetical protein